MPANTEAMKPAGAVVTLFIFSDQTIRVSAGSPPLMTIQEYEDHDDGRGPILIGARMDIDPRCLGAAVIPCAGNHVGAMEGRFDLPECLQGLLKPGATNLVVAGPGQGKPVPFWRDSAEGAAMVAFNERHFSVSDGGEINPIVGATGAGVDELNLSPAAAPARPCAFGQTCRMPPEQRCRRAECGLTQVE